jgi:Cdc6-like AAA superfamily ATPase
VTDARHPDAVISDRMAILRQRFRPSAPVDTQDLFKGRVQQLGRVFGVVSEVGQHGVLYGERGVGKTSLASVTRSIISTRRPTLHRSVRVQCSAEDSFGTVWQKFIDAMVSEVDIAPADEAKTLGDLVAKATEIINYDVVSPDRVFRGLRVLSQDAPLLVIIDEFDRIAEDGARELFADLIKVLSDNLVASTLLIVGVADDVDDLIVGHESVERALVQIPMPRMTPDELRIILVEGLEAAGLEIEPAATDRIVRLSQGLPHYTHLLGGATGDLALLNGVDRVGLDALEDALVMALQKAQQSVLRAYTVATSSAREDTLHRQVLLACALTQTDELGFFAPADVRKPFSLVMRQPKEIAAYSRHLPALCHEDRGAVLQSRGGERKRRYRFSNPLLQPYVIMRGLADGLIHPNELPEAEAPHHTGRLFDDL